MGAGVGGWGEVACGQKGLAAWPPLAFAGLAPCRADVARPDVRTRPLPALQGCRLGG